MRGVGVSVRLGGGIESGQSAEGWSEVVGTTRAVGVV